MKHVRVVTWSQPFLFVERTAKARSMPSVCCRQWQKGRVNNLRPHGMFLPGRLPELPKKTVRPFTPASRVRTPYHISRPVSAGIRSGFSCSAFSTAAVSLPVSAIRRMLPVVFRLSVCRRPSAIPEWTGSNQPGRRDLYDMVPFPGENGRILAIARCRAATGIPDSESLVCGPGFHEIVCSSGEILRYRKISER